MKAARRPRPGLHVLVDNDLMAAAVRDAATAEARPLLVLTLRAALALAEELGGDEAAFRYMLNLATETGRPFGVHVPTAAGTETHFHAPFGWTEERLQGYVAGFTDEIEATFGEVAGIRRGEP